MKLLAAQPLGDEAAALARPDEGRLLFCTAIFWACLSSSYKRECARFNGCTALVQAAYEGDVEMLQPSDRFQQRLLALPGSLEARLHGPLRAPRCTRVCSIKHQHSARHGARASECSGPRAQR